MMESSLCTSFGQTGHGGCTWYNIHSTNKDTDVDQENNKNFQITSLKHEKGTNAIKRQRLKNVFLHTNHVPQMLITIDYFLRGTGIAK